MDFINKVKAFLKRAEIPTQNYQWTSSSIETDQTRQRAESWVRDDVEYFRRNQIDTMQNDYYRDGIN